MGRSESLYFYYDGINSQDMGLLNIHTSAGLFEESVIGSRSVVENKIEGRSEPYFKYVDHEPLEFPVSFAFEDKYDKKKMREVLRWLSQNKYKPLYFSANEEKIYYAMFIGDYQHIHNGLKEGYITLDVRCNTFHAYSPTYTSPKHTITGSQIIEVDNLGDLNVKPTMYIRKNGAGDISVKNLSDGGKEFTITDLNDMEEVTVDHYHREISSNENRLLYSKSNKTYISLVLGTNQIEVSGDCEIIFETRFRLL